jgi:hypothetical protein
MSPAPSSDRDAMFATSAELDDGALAELREFTAAFERRLADAPPTESVPPAASRAAAYQGRGTIAAPKRVDVGGRCVDVRNKKSTSALKTKATKQEENGSFLTDSNRRPLLTIKVRRLLVATHGNGLGLFLGFSDSEHLPPVATGCAR